MATVAFVQQLNCHAIVQERQFADAFGQNIKIEFDHAKRFFAGQKLHARAFFGGVADGFQWGNHVAAIEFHKMLLAVAVNIEGEPIGQGIHHRHAHAVQAARDFVRVVIELTACVQNGHDDFGSRAVFFGMHVGRNAATVVFN